VNTKSCVENSCETNCDESICELCLTCLSDENLQNLHRAYRENTNRGGFKRCFPKDKQQRDKTELSEKNQISAKWFESKCKEDQNWC
jgi:hypothetical protein